MKTLSYKQLTVVTSLPTPSSTYEGVVVYDTTADRLYVCNGTAWKTFSALDGDTFTGDVTISPAVGGPQLILNAPTGSGSSIRMQENGVLLGLIGFNTTNDTIVVAAYDSAGANAHTMLSATWNGAATMRFAGSTKIATTTGGVDVTGITYTDQLNVTLRAEPTPFDGLFTVNGATYSPNSQISGNTSASSALGVFQWSTTAGAGATLHLTSVKNATEGTHTAAVTGDYLGHIQWGGSDGATFARAAEIGCVTIGAPTAGAIPSRLRIRLPNTSGTYIDSFHLASTTALFGQNPDNLAIDGTRTPRVQSVGSTTSTSAFAAWHVNNNVVNAAYIGYKSRGTQTAPTAVQANDGLISYEGFGYNGTTASFLQGAEIQFLVDGTPGAADMPGRIRFATTPVGGSAAVENMVLWSTGVLTVNKNAGLFGGASINGAQPISATYVGTYNVAAQETIPTSVFFRPDGLRMFHYGQQADLIRGYNLTTPWSLASGVTYASALSSTNFNTAHGENTGQAVFFRTDGLKFWVVGSTNNTVYQYTMSTAWDPSTGTYDSKSLVVSNAGAETVTSGLFFSTDGLHLFTLGTTADTVYRFTMSTAWDVSTASTTPSQTYSVTGQETSPRGVHFTRDGRKMYITGATGDDVTEYYLPIPWDLTSVVVQTTTLALTGPAYTVPQDVFIAPDGRNMYVVDSTAQSIAHYTVPNVGLINTGPFTQYGDSVITGDLTVSGTITGALPAGSVSYAEMQDVSATQRVLGRNTAGAGSPEEVTLSQLLDWIGSAAQGDILYRGASGWTRLAAGTSGYVLQTNGPGANPSWVAPSGGPGGTTTFTSIAKWGTD